jgi:hypothetical protein
MYLTHHGPPSGLQRGACDRSMTNRVHSLIGVTSRASWGQPRVSFPKEQRT